MQIAVNAPSWFAVPAELLVTISTELDVDVLTLNSLGDAEVVFDAVHVGAEE